MNGQTSPRGLKVLVGFALAGLAVIALPQGESLPISSIVGSISTDNELDTTCTEPEGGASHRCYQVWFRPNIDVAQSVVPGTHEAEVFLQGPGTMNSCAFFVPVDFTCDAFNGNAQAGSTHSHRVPPNTTHCHDWLAQSFGPLGDIEASHQGGRCLTVGP